MKEYNKNNYIILNTLFIIAISITFISYTLAKYTSAIPNLSNNKSVASWTFSSDNTNYNYTFDLATTYLASDIASTKIAPGTSGTLNFVLSNANSDVGVEYTISLTKENAPQNIRFYSDSGFTEQLTNNQLVGTLNQGQTSTPIVIYWKWAYETDSADNDIYDTPAGISHNNMNVTATITGKQVQPQ